mmetsp:Transcript_68754/g.152122  ORF Transcript_68754/g.152122 Transcript_68754/m.152122 type:complete len:402 (-) Transcript_68754:130-1335(-)
MAPAPSTDTPGCPASARTRKVAGTSSAAHDRSVLGALPQEENGPPTAGATGKPRTNNAVMARLQKTKMCYFFERGKCASSNCRYAHATSELRAPPNLQKTKLCQRWMESGICADGENCIFAHGEDDLRVTDGIYKTQMCHFWERGRCLKGDRCNHAHGAQDLRGPPPSTKSANTAATAPEIPSKATDAASVVAALGVLGVAGQQQRTPLSPLQPTNRLPSGCVSDAATMGFRSQVAFAAPPLWPVPQWPPAAYGAATPTSHAAIPGSPSPPGMYNMMSAAAMPQPRPGHAAATPGLGATPLPWPSDMQQWATAIQASPGACPSPEELVAATLAVATASPPPSIQAESGPGGSVVRDLGRQLADLDAAVRDFTADARGLTAGLARPSPIGSPCPSERRIHKI